MIHIRYEEIDAEWFAVAIEDERVFATSFSTSEGDVLQRLVMSLPRNMPFQKEKEPNQPAVKLLKTLKAIFNGKDASFNFQIALDPLPNYTRSVLKCVSAVPIGYVTTYNAIAEVAGGGPRAVGQAVASNPVPLLIPCHRVVRADFNIGGYGMGEKTKWLLLQRENRNYVEATTLNMNGKVLHMFPIKFVKQSRI